MRKFDIWILDESYSNGERCFGVYDKEKAYKEFIQDIEQELMSRNNTTEE